ncbi:hypothetical protein IFM89_036380 [Coptis chinensis]|uniref:Syndetin C-terminal domain-containing protein n=1 Tax=Coptis chinensis TaxID=261450 RepID=A0A835HB65_9MAGN|nr:hypothetical protein IFM89_036380 [Coptis chinensis]
MQVVSFAGLVGDGAPIIVPTDGNSGRVRALHSRKSPDPVESGNQKNGFSRWVKVENPFLIKLTNGSKEHPNFSYTEAIMPGAIGDKTLDILRHDNFSPRNSDVNHINGSNAVSEDENEDLLADFIDEDSQLPSRISKPNHSRRRSSNWNEEDITAQTGSSLCLLRLMDKYARLMQKLEIINAEFFKRDINLSGKVFTDPSTYRLKVTISRITQDCDQWIKPHNVAFSPSSPTSDVTPTSPFSANFGHAPSISFGLKKKGLQCYCFLRVFILFLLLLIVSSDSDSLCVTGKMFRAETIQIVKEILHRSKSHMQSMLQQNNAAMVEDFYASLVDSVPDLTEHIHRTTARSHLHISGYVDRIANAKWELKDLGLEHNGLVSLDLLMVVLMHLFLSLSFF